MTSLFPKPRLLIVGAGELGATAAAEALASGNYDVTILDRAPSIPAVDAASTDINKAVRFDYADEDYAKLAKESMRLWKQDKWRGAYRESGVVFRNISEEFPESIAVYNNAVKLEPHVRLLTTREEVSKALSPSGGAKLGAPTLAAKAYFNPSGGWVHASGAMSVVYDDIKRLGGTLVPGAELASLIIENGDVRGVRCADGREFHGDKVILALGSWTGGHPALKGVVPEGLMVPTGQTIAAVQLSKDEYERYKDLRVVSFLDGSGFYCFPPTPDGIMKFALHSGGYVNEANKPRTAGDSDAVAYADEKRVGWIPSDSFRFMRSKYAELYPEIAAKPMAFTRMCWYSDTPDSDFVIDYTKYPNLMVASGGAGHAFKFLPVMGSIILARLEARLSPQLAHKWRLDRPVVEFQGKDRGGIPRAPLVLENLVSTEELGPERQAKL